MAQKRPARLLVLGTRLGEFTSFWNQKLIPDKGIIHVDVDPAVPGAAFPEVWTDAVHSEIGQFLRSLLDHIPRTSRLLSNFPRARAAPLEADDGSLVRPQALMEAVQRVVVDGSDAPVLVDVGNSFAWATRCLTFNSPGRFRVSMGWGSMGQAAAGVVGAALARQGKAVAIVGDGALLMQNEINTAVQYGAQAVLIVLNDSQYGMIEQGMRSQQMKPVQTQMPLVDFVGLARSLGADGCMVQRESELDAALTEAMRATRPYVVDVRIDKHQASPMMSRIASLIEQGVRGPSDEG
jgi:acetolactate synthase-1/2/3 large subunit